MVGGCGAIGEDGISLLVAMAEKEEGENFEVVMEEAALMSSAWVPYQDYQEKKFIKYFQTLHVNTVKMYFILSYISFDGDKK